MNNTRLLENIKNLCKENGIGTTQLEKTLGISAGVIGRWNKSDPSLSKVIAIAKYFNVSLDYLVYGPDTTINNKFIETLQQLTFDNIIQWQEILFIKNKEIKTDVPVKYKFPIISKCPDPYYVRIFYAKYNDGFVSVCLFDDTEKEPDIKDYKYTELYIQVDYDSEPILQKDMSEDEIRYLWDIIYAKKHEPDSTREYKEKIINELLKARGIDFGSSYVALNKFDMEKLNKSLPQLQNHLIYISDIVNRCTREDTDATTSSDNDENSTENKK